MARPDVFDSLNALTGMQGDEAQDSFQSAPLPYETPGMTQGRVNQQNSQRIQYGRIKAEDLSQRGVAYETTPRGDVREVTDATGSPLTNADKSSKIAYDSSGKPMDYSQRDPATGRAKVQDAYAGTPDWTDQKTGDTYKRRTGLPWLWTGTDPDVQAQVQAQQTGKLNQQTSAALAPVEAQTRTQATEASKEVKASGKAAKQAMHAQGLTIDPTGDPIAVRQQIEDTYNQEYGRAKANSTPWFGGGKLSPDAESYRKDIDARKAAALAVVDQHQAVVQKANDAQGSLDQIRQQRAQLQGDRLGAINDRRTAAGLEPVGSVAKDQQEAAVPRSLDNAEQQSPVASGDDDEARTAVQQSLKSAQAGQKAYGYDDKSGAIHFDPEKPYDGLKQAARDGVIDMQWAKDQESKFKIAQEKYEDLLKTAGDNQEIKALIHGGGLGGAFLAGSIPGGKIGGKLGAAIPGLGETGLGEIAGAAIGGLTTGSIAVWGASKGLDKLSAYSDALKSLNASAELHPYYDEAGQLLAYGTQAPKAISNLVKLGKIAGGGIEAAKAIGMKVAGGATGGLAFEAGPRVLFDAAVNTAQNALGIPAQEVQAPSVKSLVTNAALGVLLAGHDLRFNNYTVNDATSILYRDKVREMAGVAPDAQMSVPDVVETMKKAGIDIDSQKAADLARPLTPAEQHFSTATKAKLQEMADAGVPGVEFRSGEQATNAAGKPIASKVEVAPTGEAPNEPTRASESPIQPPGLDQPPQPVRGEPAPASEAPPSSVVAPEASRELAARQQELAEMAPNDPNRPLVQLQIQQLANQGTQDTAAPAQEVQQTAPPSQPVAEQQPEAAAAIQTSAASEPPSHPSPEAPLPTTPQPTGESPAPSPAEQSSPPPAEATPQTTTSKESIAESEQGQSSPEPTEPAPSGKPAPRSADTAAEIHDQIFKANQEGRFDDAIKLGKKLPSPASTKPVDVLHNARNVKITAPRGAKFLQVVDNKGRKITEPIDNVAKGLNPFHQAGPFKSVTAGVMNSKKELVPLKGTIEITDANAKPAEPRENTFSLTGLDFAPDQEPRLIHSSRLESKNPLGLRTATRQPSGKVDVAKEAGHHFQLPSEEGSEFGFVTRGGKFLTREQASKEIQEAKQSPESVNVAKLAKAALALHHPELDTLGHPREFETGSTRAGSGIETDVGSQRIRIDPEKLAQSTARMTPQQRMEWVKRAVAHEVIHVATLKYAEDAGNREKLMGLTADEELMKRAADAYGPEWDRQSDFAKAAEAARMLIEGPEKLTEASYKFLKDFLEWLKSKLKNLSKDAREVIRGIEEKLGRFDKEAETTKENAPPEKRGSTQVTLADKDAEPIRDFVKGIPESELYHGEEGSDTYGPEYGRELESHVTSLYGLVKGGDTPKAVSSAVEKAGIGPVKLTLGKMSAFENPDSPYDVLKLDVESPDLHALNAALKKLPFKSDFPDYHPHLTLAYLKKGEAAKYVGDDRFKGKQITIDQLTHSSAEREKTKIPLASETPATPETLRASIAEEKAKGDPDGIVDGLERELARRERKTEKVSPPSEAAKEVQQQITKANAGHSARPAKEIKAELVQRLKDAIKTAPELTDKQSDILKKIPPLGKHGGISNEIDALESSGLKKQEFQIPGDGAFKLWNAKTVLADVLRRVEKMPTTLRDAKPGTQTAISAKEPQILADQAADQLGGRDAAIEWLKENSASATPTEKKINEAAVAILESRTPTEQHAKDMENALYAATPDDSTTPKGPAGQGEPQPSGSPRNPLASGGTSLKTLYRASDRDDAKAGAHFSETESDAKAYQDNPGFGGSKLQKYSVDDSRVAEVATLRELASKLEPLLSEDQRQWAYDNGGLLSAMKGMGYDHTFHALENSFGPRGDRINTVELLAKNHDWIRFTDDFPEGSKTWRYIGSDTLNPINESKGAAKVGRPLKYDWKSVDWLLEDKEIADAIGAPRGVVRNKRLELGEPRGVRTSKVSRALSSERLKQRWSEDREKMMSIQQNAANLAGEANRKVNPEGQLTPDNDGTRPNEELSPAQRNEKLMEEAEAAGLQPSLELIKGILRNSPESMDKLRAMIRDRTGKESINAASPDVALKPSTIALWKRLIRPNDRGIPNNSEVMKIPDDHEIHTQPNGQMDVQTEAHPRPKEEVVSNSGGVTHFAEEKGQKGYKTHRFVTSDGSSELRVLEHFPYDDKKMAYDYTRPSASNIEFGFTKPDARRKGGMRKLILAADESMATPLKPDYMNTPEMMSVMRKMMADAEPGESLGAANPIDSMREAYDSLADSMKVRGSKKEVAFKQDAVGTRANYYGQQAGDSIRLDLPEKKDREAMPFVIEAGGDPKKVQQMDQKIVASTNPNLSKKYGPIIDHAINNFDRLNKASANHDRMMKESVAELKANGIDLGEVENYVTRKLDAPDAVKDVLPNPLFSMGSGNGGSRYFAKGRAFETLADAIKAGYPPLSTDLADLDAHRIEAGKRLIFQKQLFDELRQTPSPTDGKPIIGEMETRKTLNGKTEQVVPRGYTVVQAAGTPLVIHNDFAGLFKNLFGDSAIRRNALGRAAIKAAALVKHGTLAVDTFHIGRVLFKMATAGGGGPFTTRNGHLAWNIHKGRALLEYSDQDLGRALAMGDITKKEADYARANRPKVERLMKSGMNVGKVADNLMEQAKMHLPIITPLNNWIFGKLSRSAMLQASLGNLERNLKNPNLTEAQAYRQTAKEMNELFGNLQNQGVLQSKTLQDISRLIFLAPNWTESQFRNEMRAYGQTATAPVNFARGKGLRLGNSARIFAAGLVALLAANQVANFLTRGKSTFDNEEKDHKMDAWMPGGKRGFWFSPLEIAGEYAHAANKYLAQHENPMDVATHIASNKLSPLARGAKELLTGRDAQGKHFLNNVDRVRGAVTDALPVPMFTQPFMERDPRQALGFRATRTPGAAEKQLLQSSGMKVTAAQSPRSQMFAIAQPFRADRQQNDAAGEYTELRRALDNDDTTSARSEITWLMDRGKDANAIKRAVGIKASGEIGTEKFAGSEEREEEMLRSLKPDERKIYAQAQREHVENALRLLKILPTVQAPTTRAALKPARSYEFR